MTRFLPPKMNLALLLLFLALATMFPYRVAGAKLDEYQVKAGFVLNFALLTEWPAESQGDQEPLSIGIVGKVPATFISSLKTLTFHGKRVAVKHLDTIEEAKNVRVLFISISERYRLPAILRELRHQTVLTVSDMSGFCEAGGMIGLVPIQKRLGYEVNIAAVRKAHLAISSQMLKLARIVYGN